MINYLKPKNVNYKKVRIGPREDGGYVMPEIVLTECVALFAYGIGYNWGFEDEFANMFNKPVYMFDHTMGQENWNKENIHFFNEGLGYQRGCKDVLEHYSELGIHGNIFLKVDIEGAEYDYFLQTDLKRLASICSGISLEVHWIDDTVNRNKFIQVMSKLSEYYTLCHVHGNNWGGLWYYEGFNIPKVLELSFINKTLVKLEEEEVETFPISGLDYPNNPTLQDYKLDFINYREDPSKIEHYYKGVPSGWFDYEEIYNLAISRVPEESTAKFVELGVWFGQSLCYAGVEVINSKKNIIIHGIDSFQHGDRPLPGTPVDYNRYSEAIRYTEKVNQVVTLVKSNTYEASKLYEDESLDFVFMDAGHTYEDVQLDLKDWYPKVKKGGIIGGHDYNFAFNGVIQAVDEFFGKNNISVLDQSHTWYFYK